MTRLQVPWSRQEYVQNLVAPTDMPDEISPDENLYAQVFDWAEEQEMRLMSS